MGLKLNLACNINLLPPPWINIDIVEPREDLIVRGVEGKWSHALSFRRGDATNLDWLAPSTVDEIQADFILEHFHIDRVPDVLYEWCRVLVSGGVIHARVPDGEFYAQRILEFSRQPNLLRWMKFRLAGFELLNPVEDGPLGDGPGAAHKSIWSRAAAELLFSAQGFTIETSFETDEKQGLRTLLIEATKGMTPAGYTATQDVHQPAEEPSPTDHLEG